MKNRLEVEHCIGSLLWYASATGQAHADAGIKAKTLACLAEYMSCDFEHSGEHTECSGNAMGFEPCITHIHHVRWQVAGRY